MEENLVKWYSQSDRALLELLGNYIQKTRLQQNKTQEETALTAGINRSTLIQIEAGKGGTLLSFVQILRALGQLHLLKNFEFRRELSPLQIAEMEMKQRRRARKSPSQDKPQSEW